MDRSSPTSTLTPELVRETLRRADSPLALGAAIARAGRAAGVAISDADGVEAVTDAAVCEECGGTGHMPIITRANGEPIPEGYIGFERCDACQKYDSDLAAATAYGLSDIREHGSGLVGRPPVTDLGDGLGLEHDDQPRRTLGATLAAMPELARNPHPTNSLRIVGRLRLETAPGSVEIFCANGTRVASIFFDYMSHMDPKMRHDAAQAKAIGQALVDLWNADYDVTTQQVHTDTMDKLQTDRT